MIPKMLLSLDDYETDVENLGVTPNEIGVPDPDSDMALDITNQFMTDRRCSFLSTGTNFATQLREKGKLTEFYQAGWQWSWVIMSGSSSKDPQAWPQGQG